MSSWIIALYPLLILALAGVAIYEHQKSLSLSLPLSPLLTALSILLPLLAALNALYHPSLLALSRAKNASTAQKLLPTLLQALQLILTTVLATLLASDTLPSPARDCLLETRWKGFWTAHDAESIRKVQDALSCCGFRTVKDMVWPFPHGAPGGGGPGAADCVARFGRTVACREPWQRAMQDSAGWDWAVVLAVGGLQVLSWVMGRRGPGGGWVESFWGRLAVKLFGGREGGVHVGGEGSRPLLTERDGGEERESDVEGGEGRAGEGGFQYGGTDDSQRWSA
ncbi:hypothetical protein QBC39DRAFT_365568 [Podospora conica]|nr:hypothetical protein QBC39DRAFT_365568 [Schizothecium conicum]